MADLFHYYKANKGTSLGSYFKQADDRDVCLFVLCLPGHQTKIFTTTHQNINCMYKKRFLIYISAVQNICAPQS